MRSSFQNFLAASASYSKSSVKKARAQVVKSPQQARARPDQIDGVREPRFTFAPLRPMFPARVRRASAPLPHREALLPPARLLQILRVEPLELGAIENGVGAADARERKLLDQFRRADEFRRRCRATSRAAPGNCGTPPAEILLPRRSPRWWRRGAWKAACGRGRESAERARKSGGSTPSAR